MQKGDKFRHAYQVTDKQYEGFIDIFDDRNPLHTDKAFATSLGMPDKVMHGNILNGFISHFIGECLPVKNVIIHTQSIAYTKPVFLNDKLSLEAEIAEHSAAVNIYGFKFTFRNEKAERVAKGTVQIGLL